MLTCQKHHFSLPEDLHYLNAAYMSPLSREVEAAGLEGLRQKRNPSNITPAHFFDESDAVRQRFATLVNIADPRRVALIPAASYGLATVARNLNLSPGQTVVVLHEQFPSNVYTWRRMCREQRLRLLTITPPPEGKRRGAAWNDRLLEAIDERTGLVAIPHVHWTDGTVFDLKAVRERTHSVGAALVIDGTQSVGAYPFDVQTLQPDALVCAGYKWLLGPYGIGVAYYGPRFDNGVPLEENWITRAGSEDFAGLVNYTDAYQPGAIRYDVGERSNFILVPMLRAGLDHLLTWGVDEIQRYCRTLAAPLVAEARALGFRAEDDAFRAGHLFGLRMPAGLEVEALRRALSERNISVSVRGDALRVSPHVYNTPSDVDALLEALRTAVRVLR